MYLLNDDGSSEWAFPLFCEKAKQLREFTSLFQSRKDLLKTLPGIGDFPGILGTMNTMDPKLDALAAELIRLQYMTRVRFLND